MILIFDKYVDRGVASVHVLGSKRGSRTRTTTRIIWSSLVHSGRSDVDSSLYTPIDSYAPGRRILVRVGTIDSSSIFIEVTRRVSISERHISIHKGFDSSFILTAEIRLDIRECS